MIFVKASFMSTRSAITVFVAVHRIILAQRIAFPIDRHQDAHQVGMIAETDAEHVEDFALIPVGPAPDARDRIDLRIRAAQPALHAQPLIALDRMQMIDHFKARLGRMPVDRGHRAQADELLFVLEIAAQIDDPRRVGDERRFAERFDGFENRRRCVTSTLRSSVSGISQPTNPARPSSTRRRIPPGSAPRT